MFHHSSTIKLPDWLLAETGKHHPSAVLEEDSLAVSSEKKVLIIGPQLLKFALGVNGAISDEDESVLAENLQFGLKTLLAMGFKLYYLTSHQMVRMETLEQAADYASEPQLSFNSNDMWKALKRAHGIDRVRCEPLDFSDNMSVSELSNFWELFVQTFVVKQLTINCYEKLNFSLSKLDLLVHAISLSINTSRHIGGMVSRRCLMQYLDGACHLSSDYFTINDFSALALMVYGSGYFKAALIYAERYSQHHALMIPLLSDLSFTRLTPDLEGILDNFFLFYRYLVKNGSQADIDILISILGHHLRKNPRDVNCFYLEMPRFFEDDVKNSQYLYQKLLDNRAFRAIIYLQDKLSQEEGELKLLPIGRVSFGNVTAEQQLFLNLLPGSQLSVEDSLDKFLKSSDQSGMREILSANDVMNSLRKKWRYAEERKQTALSKCVLSGHITQSEDIDPGKKTVTDEDEKYRLLNDLCAEVSQNALEDYSPGSFLECLIEPGDMKNSAKRRQVDTYLGDDSLALLSGLSSDKKILGKDESTESGAPIPSDDRFSSDSERDVLSQEQQEHQAFVEAAHNNYNNLLLSYVGSIVRRFGVENKDHYTSPFLSETVLNQKGVYGVTGEVTDSLKMLSDFGRDRYDYYLDADALLESQDTLNSDRPCVVNLSPWHVTDRGSQDRLRVRLHDFIDKHRESLCLILLISDPGYMLSDSSFESRLTQIYQAPPSEQDHSFPITEGASDDNDCLPLSMPVILRWIKNQLIAGNHSFSLVVYGDQSDSLRLGRLRQAIKNISYTGAFVVDGQVYQSDFKQCDIQLVVVPIEINGLLQEVVVSDADRKLPQERYLLTPHLATYWLKGQLQSEENQSDKMIHCHVVQALSMEAWHALLTSARNNNCRIVLTADDQDFLPSGYGQVMPLSTVVPNTAKLIWTNNPAQTAMRKSSDHASVELFSFDELDNLSALLCSSDNDKCGEIARHLFSGKKVRLYAQENLDDAGDLHQFLMLLMQGRLVSFEGEMVRFDVQQLEVVLNEADTMSSHYFSQFSAQKILENNSDSVDLFGQFMLDKHQEHCVAEQDFSEQLPDLISDSWAIPNEAISEGRLAQITILWKFLLMAESGRNVLPSLIVSGPSSLAKTALVKQLVKNRGYRLMGGDSLTSSLDNNEQKICWHFQHSESKLPAYLDYARQNGQLVLIDELNSLSARSQQLVIDTLRNDNRSPGFAVIGTLNEGYYPGRELLPRLQQLSRQAEFGFYSKDECLPIIESQLRGALDQSDEQFVGEVSHLLNQSLPAQSDGFVRSMARAVACHDDELKKVFVSWLESTRVYPVSLKKKNNSKKIENKARVEKQKSADDYFIFCFRAIYDALPSKPLSKVFPECGNCDKEFIGSYCASDNKNINLCVKKAYCLADAVVNKKIQRGELLTYLYLENYLATFRLKRMSSVIKGENKASLSEYRGSTFYRSGDDFQYVAFHVTALFSNSRQDFSQGSRSALLQDKLTPVFDHESSNSL